MVLSGINGLRLIVHDFDIMSCYADATDMTIPHRLKFGLLEDKHDVVCELVF